MVIADQDDRPRLPDWSPLHTHTLASDGVYSPLLLWQMTQRAHARSLVITDHHTLAGYRTLRPYRAILRRRGCALFAGIETTVYEDNTKDTGHLTVLIPDAPQSDLLDRVEDLCQSPPVSLRTLASLPVLVLSGCQGGLFWRTVHLGPPEKQPFLAIRTLLQWRHLFGDRLYLEMMPGQHEQWDATVSRITQVRLVVTADIHGNEQRPFLDGRAVWAFHPQDSAWLEGIRETQRIIRRLTDLEMVL